MSKTFTVGLNGSFPNPARSEKLREERIRDLAYWLYDTFGLQDPIANWLSAEEAVDFIQHLNDRNPFNNSFLSCDSEFVSSPFEGLPHLPMSKEVQSFLEEVGNGKDLTEEINANKF